MPECSCYAFLCVSYLPCTQVKSWLKIRLWPQIGSPSHRGVKTIQMDGRSSHEVSADCVDAACKCMKHEAGPTYRKAKHAAPYKGIDFSVDGSLRQEMHAKDPTPTKISFTHRHYGASSMHKTTHVFLHRHIYTHAQINLTSHSCMQAHTSRLHHGGKVTAWCKMVWLHEVNEQPQPEGGEMIGR